MEYNPIQWSGLYSSGSFWPRAHTCVSCTAQGIPSITTLNINRLQRLQSNDKGGLNGYKNNTHIDVAHKSLISDLKMESEEIEDFHTNGN